MNVFKIVYPEFIVQEFSKNLSAFIMHGNPIDGDVDYKEFINNNLKDVNSLWISNGADVLLSDYKLSKHLAMQIYNPLKAIVIEFGSPGSALEGLLQLN